MNLGINVQIENISWSALGIFTVEIKVFKFLNLSNKQNVEIDHAQNITLSSSTGMKFN